MNEKSSGQYRRDGGVSDSVWQIVSKSMFFQRGRDWTAARILTGGTIWAAMGLTFALIIGVLPTKLYLALLVKLTAIAGASRVAEGVILGGQEALVLTQPDASTDDATVSAGQAKPKEATIEQVRKMTLDSSTLAKQGLILTVVAIVCDTLLPLFNLLR